VSLFCGEASAARDRVDQFRARAKEIEKETSKADFERIEE
jgi:hypothetical protein